MEKLVLVDGNSIMNRAFYGIMGSKMLTSKDGIHTNAIYGFLAILFKLLEEVNPKYMAISFDLKAPTKRHKLYEEYKANRKGMPNELAEQMPIIKEILQAMNIKIIEKEGFEADDILGTLSCYGEQNNLEVIILSGDKDTFQLATDKVTIRIPRTKSGQTETENYNKTEIVNKYGLNPKQLIDVKGLQGDSSDNIPGVPGIGEKTALKLIQEYGTIENLYNSIEQNKDNLKGKQREKIIENKELAVLSKELGTINLEVPVNITLEDLELKEWDNQKVYSLFKNLNLNRYIERFSLGGDSKENKKENLFKVVDKDIENILKEIKITKELIAYFYTEHVNDNTKIIKQKIKGISIYNKEKLETYYVDFNKNVNKLKEILEDEAIKKVGIDLGKIYILLKQENINLKGIYFDISISAYILDPTNSKLQIKDLMQNFLEIEVESTEKVEKDQINLFDQELEEVSEELKKELGLYAYAIDKVKEITELKLKEINCLDLFYKIDMPIVEVLAQMQLNGMYLDKQELENFGEELTEKLEKITKKIYEMAGEEFNINSPKQLGEILFEKLKLPVIKKTKSGYSTDVDVLEKLRKKAPIIEQILEYRQLMKLNSTYVEGLKPYINPQTNRIHSFFHQTITATGRISSTEPNLQNIPTRFELGKRVRKVFKPQDGYVYIDTDYSQIELRVLSHISKDQNMIEAFNNGEDIHKQAASKVFGVPIEEVTKEQRSSAKAVNFGIVYGISDFGLSTQLGITKKEAKNYIDQYLIKYSGIKEFMEKIVEETKQKGYVETLFNRRRYVPELKSNNFIVKNLGKRIAMNTPIQGSAADIMKIAMINVYNKLKEKKMKSKIVLQVHDELIIEAIEEEKEEVKKILKETMESAAKLNVPLIADVSEAKNWYEAH